MNAVGMTGWTFLLAGITLLPITLLAEGLPDRLTRPHIGGLVYLVADERILAYALWFWGLQHLTASSVTFSACSTRWSPQSSAGSSCTSD